MSDHIIVSNGEEGDAGVTVELPTENDGSLLLSVLQSQFEGATGLKYKNPDSGAWRGVRISDGVLQPPTGNGWGPGTVYCVVVGSVKEMGRKEKERDEIESVDRESRGSRGMAGQKRAHYDDYPQYYSKSSRQLSDSPPPPPPHHPGGSGGGKQQHSGDLIVLGLRYDINEQELRDYFEHYGEVEQAEIKRDPKTHQSRGFGFLKFKDPSIQDKVMRMTHTIKGRRCELRPPRKSPGSLPCKFFIGCLPNDPETSTEELRAYFSQFGQLSDVYIPKPYRGFGFVTYLDGYEAQSMYKEIHVLRNQRLNVSIAEPKPGAKGEGPSRGGRGGDYSRHASSYQATPAHVYAYSLVPQSGSGHSATAAYVPAAQYYAYQSATPSASGQYSQGHQYSTQYSSQYGASTGYGNNYN